jgi:hypothetical protein
MVSIISASYHASKAWWQTKLAIPLSGRISRQFAPDFEISHVALHCCARRLRKIERWGKLTGNPAVGMGNLCSNAKPVHAWIQPLSRHKQDRRALLANEMQSAS